MEERRCICPLLRDHVRHRQADFSAHGVRANYFFLVRSPGNPVLDYLWRLNPREFVYALPCLLVLTVINMLMCLPFISKSPHRHTIKA